MLFAVLVGFTSYWSVFDAEALRGQDANKRPLLEEQQIKRGADPRRRRHGARPHACRGPRRATALRAPLPDGRAVRPPGRLQLRRSYGRRGLRAVPQRRAGRRRRRVQLDPRRARAATTQEGDDVVTDARPGGPAGRASTASARRATGAVVAIEPQTGAVRVMASNPPYDPNRDPDDLERARTRTPDAPLLNRATQGQLPAGLDLQGGDRRRGARQRHVHAGHDDRRGGHRKEISGVAAATTSAARTSAPIALDRALTNSVNTGLGPGRREARARTRCSSTWTRFGFNREPAIDLPRRPDGRQRRSSTGRRAARPAATRSTSAASRSARSACWRHPAADGRGRRGDRQRRRADEAATLEPTVVDPDGRDGRPASSPSAESQS